MINQLSQINKEFNFLDTATSGQMMLHLFISLPYWKGKQLIFLFLI